MVAKVERDGRPVGGHVIATYERWETTGKVLDRLRAPVPNVLGRHRNSESV